MSNKVHKVEKNVNQSDFLTKNLYVKIEKVELKIKVERV